MHASRRSVTAQRPARRSVTTLAGALAASALLAACSHGSGTDAGTPDGTDPQASGKPTQMEILSPLTGRSMTAVPRRPILTLKVDNSASSAPQIGLSKADMITEELVEGGITRLAVSFYSGLPSNAGPVRSMRASDIGIVQPLKSVIVTSGGAAQTIARIRKAGITFKQEGAPGFARATDRYAPYNLFVNLMRLARTLPKGTMPGPYLPFGTAKLPPGRPAKGLTAVFSPASSSTFAFQGGHYVNTDSNSAEGDRFLADTVLVMRVQVGLAGYLDPAGYPVPETKFTGSGPAQVFHGGRLVNATWTKSGYDAPITLSTKSGALDLPPGRVWIELVPADTGSVSVVRR